MDGFSNRRPGTPPPSPPLARPPPPPPPSSSPPASISDLALKPLPPTHPPPPARLPAPALLSGLPSAPPLSHPPPWWPDPTDLTFQMLDDACARGNLDEVTHKVYGVLAVVSQRQLDLACFNGSITKAILAGHVHIVEHFIHSGLFNCNRLPIYGAIQAKSTAVLQLFLDCGWNINQPCDDVTPPYLASAVSDPDLTRWFLEHGADPNARCPLLDLTPTSYAVADGPMEVLDILLDNGADIHKGQLLHHAVQRSADAEEFVVRLIDLGCPVNEVKYQNDPISWAERSIHGLGTALHRAAEFRSVRMVRILLERGADPRVLDSKGVTALYWAKYRHRDDVVRVLEEWEP